MPLSILDLPTELLLAIFTDTDPQDVYSLALVCRRLHFTAMPVYFSHHGFHSSSRSVQILMHTDRRNLLTALRVALFDTPLDHISFIFSLSDRYLDPIITSVTPLLEQFRRAKGFLSDFTSIRSLSLDLDHRDRLSYLPVGGGEALRAWAKGFGELLNCIVETQCTTLTVLHGSYFAKAFQLAPGVKPASRLRQLTSWLKTVAAREAPRFLRVSQQGVPYVAIALPRKFSRASHLTCIHIHSTTLILPPGLSWMLGVLRSCPVSQLTFSKIRVESDTWATVLPLIASTGARLTSVGFIDLHLPEPEIMDFLPRLPNLVDITMSPSERFSDLFMREIRLSFRRAPPPHLPRLTHLRADPVSVRYLLSREGSLPALNTVTIVFCPSSGIEDIAEILSIFVSMLATYPRVPAPLLAVATIRSTYPLLSSNEEVTPDSFATLDRVQRLEVNWVITWDMVEGAIKRMVLWVAAFRRAKSVAIKLEPQADVGDMPQRLASSIVRTEFLQAIEVNGKEYPLVHGDGKRG
ncbi:hypothetical protein DFH06DRAFT_1305128 [Mycena polygramma]|nr:hypothetical protein DFH06DRAFT_1305128 [Mycena polygramma]